MALPLDDLVSWLTDNGIEGVDANWMSPDAPDAVVIVSGGPGGPPINDGSFEPMLIHVRCRDASDSAAEATALAVHGLICGLKGSVTMGATGPVSIEGASGPPVFLMRDVAGRTTYLATYSAMTPIATA